jgi:hypothetical protein
MTCETNLGHVVGQFDVDVKQGSDLTLTLEFTDENGIAIDVSSYTFSGHIRPTALSTTLSAAFTFDTANASSGVVVATLLGSSTASLATGENPRHRSSVYYYDVRYVFNGISTYFLQGQINLVRRVTR